MKKKPKTWRDEINNKVIADVLIVSMSPKQKNMVQIMEVLQKNPRASLRDIYRKTGIATGTAHETLRSI